MTEYHIDLNNLANGLKMWQADQNFLICAWAWRSPSMFFN